MMPTARRVLTSGTTTGQFIPMTGWIPAINVKEMKSLLQLRDKTDNFQVQVALQTADVDTDSPNSALGKGSFAAVDPRWGRFTAKEFDQYIRSESALSPEQGIDLEAALTSLEPLGLARMPVSAEEAQRRAQRGRPTLLIHKENRQPYVRVLVGWDEPLQHWVVSDPKYPTVQVQTWESLSHALLSHESGIQAIWTCPLSEPDCPMD